MHRIYACVLVLGVAGLFGFGLMHSAAQTDNAPALKPEHFKPANFVDPRNSTTEMTGPALVREPVAPIVPPPLDPLPTSIQKSEPPPLILPPRDIDVKAVRKKDKPTSDEPLEIPLLPAPFEPTKSKPEPVAPVLTPPLEPTSPRIDAKLAPLELAKPPAPTGSPGNRLNPSVSIETIGPEAMPYGQAVTYEILVKNHGSVAVSHVRVDEELGAGTKFVGAEPAGEINADKLLWMLGSLNAGEEKRIKVSVKPGNDGDLYTKPRVSFSAATAMQVRITRPKIVVTVTGPEAAQVGDDTPLQIHVSNNGSGQASKIMLKAVLSEGLKHPEGNDIQAVLDNLAPGQSQVVTLRVQAATQGIQQCALSASCEGAAMTTAQARVDVRQPKLTLAVVGPMKCVVRAEPVFTLALANPGTGATEPIQLAAAFPEGLDFVTASDGGTYDPAIRTVSWNLGPAPAGSKRNLTVKMKSAIAGNLAVRAVAQAGPRLHARAEAIIQTEGVPALLFEVVDLEDPIEVGKETTYEIRIANTGTMHCTNVKVTAAISDGLSLGAITASVPHKIVEQTLIFEPIAKLPVKGDMLIRVKAKATLPGDLRFKVQLSCDQLKQPVVKEESTSFFQP